MLAACFFSDLLMLFPFCFSFKKLLQLGADERSPSFHKILARERRSLRKSLRTCMRQFQPRFVAVSEQFKRDQRIALVSFIPPGVSNFLLRNHLGHPAKMVIRHAFMLDDEFKLRT